MKRFSGPSLVGLVAISLSCPVAAQQQTQYSLTLYEQPDYRGASVTFYSDNANIGSTGFTNRARSAQVRGTWRLCEGGGYRTRCEVLSENVRDLDAYGLAGRVGSAQRLATGPSAGPPPNAPPRSVPSPYPPPAYALPNPYAPPDAVDDAPRLAPYGERRGRVDDRFNPPAAPSPYTRPYREEPYPPAVDAPARPAAPAQAEDRGVEGWSSVFFARPSLRGEDVSAWPSRAADAFCRDRGLGAALSFDQDRRSARSLDSQGRPSGEGPVLSDVLCRK